MTRATAALLAAFLLLSDDSAHAQVGPPEAPRPPAIVELPDNAQQTRMQLQRLLRQYPPAVGEVLMRDPSLMTRADYLAPYPALGAFLSQHPEVVRNPSFFLGSFFYRERDPKELAFEAMGVVLGALAGMAAFVVVVALFVWVIRAVIDHRRWLRLSRVQTEVHTKLMDRLTSNDDLLAYIQSPAGRRFLESTPIALEGEARPTTAPLSRILWSLQAGIVLVALGIGFWLAQNRVMPEIADGFYVFGMVAMAVGIGFALSSVAAYVISTRLGLVSATRNASGA
jgi:hypothetical protein